MPKLLPALDTFDLGVLSERGVSVETARRNRLHTDSKSGEMVIPFADLDGVFNSYAVRRPHTPPVIDGKPRKYVAPAGQPCRLYIPAESRDKLRDPSAPVVLTEGMLKALVLAQSGYAAAGLLGVWNWKKKGTNELIPGLAEVPWTGRDVLIVYDFDPKLDTRRNVDLARRRLATALRNAGAGEVYSVELPAGPDGAKQGVDDYIVANGLDAFKELVELRKPVPSPDAFHPITRAEGRTDASNATRFVSRHGVGLRWVGPWNKWLLWDGVRWKPDKSRRIDREAKNVAADLFAEIAAVLKAAETAGEGMRRDDRTLSAMYAHAKHSNSRGGIESMIALARGELAIDSDLLDSDPWLLNLGNGTLNLRTGELREHRREDYITKLVPVEFDAAAECPLWDTFLQTIFAGDRELIEYVRRLVGYSLTGVTEEHILPFGHGAGANGKSTFIETVLKLLGPDYAMKAAPDLLMARRGEAHPTDRADLFGKRLVACVETEEGRRFAESLVKEMTGGDRMRARRMREDFWEFAPTHHVWLAGNHKPQVVGTDHGIWRRIKLIPFTVVIPDAEQDKKLPAKLVAELPGILNWAIAGCLDWQRGGMREPECVRVATSGYSTEMDEVGKFIDENCELGDFLAPAGELYTAFKEAMPDSRITQHAFGARLRQKGFLNHDPATGKEYRTSKGKHGWKGLRLRKDGVGERVVSRLKTKNGGV